MNDYLSNDMDRIGNWMLSYQGNKIYPLDLRPEDIDILDIAHALSNICRFGGHCTSFYSVAQHCIIVCSAVEHRHKKAALLHDATEAYVGDMVRPLKVQMPEFCAMEEKIWPAICERYSIATELDRSIDLADARALITEKRDITTQTNHVWEFPQCKYPRIEPFRDKIVPWSTRKSERIFLQMWNQIIKEEGN